MWRVTPTRPWSSFRVIESESRSWAATGWRCCAGSRGPWILQAETAPPPEETRPGWGGGCATRCRRDWRAMSHRYDVSNRFYEWILGPSMAYTCTVYPVRRGLVGRSPGEEKVDLVCRKLDLQPGPAPPGRGLRMGDARGPHAASHYGVRVIGVTLSGASRPSTARSGSADLGLSDAGRDPPDDDYRNVTEGGFDAISSIGLTEHIGARGTYHRVTPVSGRQAAGPQGRLLNHCITRPLTSAPSRTGREGSSTGTSFPTGSSRGSATDLGHAGQRPRDAARGEPPGALRPDAGRVGGNLDAHWDEAVNEVGEGRARVWRLYLAGSRLGTLRNASSCTRCWASGCTPTGPPACRCGPTGTCRRL